MTKAESEQMMISKERAGELPLYVSLRSYDKKSDHTAGYRGRVFLGSRKERRRGEVSRQMNPKKKHCILVTGKVDLAFDSSCQMQKDQG